jgi:hypothetical protein
MKRLKRLLVTFGALASALALVTLLAAISAVLVLVGSGADPTDAFRAPDLGNTSISAELSWTDGTGTARLGTLEADRLADGWADAVALIERRSNGEAVDFGRRFDPTIARSLAADGPNDWSPFTVIEHRITIDLVSRNRQVVAITADVTVRRAFSNGELETADTYEAILANGVSGWVVVTLNRTDSLIRS